MDNSYNSPELACFLKSKETECVGTLCIIKKKCSSLGESQKPENGRLVWLAFRVCRSSDLA
jgi:hypothetical protein